MIRSSVKHDDVNEGAPFEFTATAGNPHPLGSQIEEITRRGVDGAAFRTTGQQARPFQLRTHRDITDATLIEATRELYKEYQGRSVTLSLARNGITTTYNYVVVLAVRPLETRTIVNATGGCAPDPNVLLVDEWDLQLTEFT